MGAPTRVKKRSGNLIVTNLIYARASTPVCLPALCLDRVVMLAKKRKEKKKKGREIALCAGATVITLWIQFVYLTQTGLAKTPTGQLRWGTRTQLAL